MDMKIDDSGRSADTADVPVDLLRTPYALAQETGRKDRAICDPKAAEIADSLDRDVLHVLEDGAAYETAVSKAAVLDRMIDGYLSSRRRTSVINMACGLDTRCYRLSGKYIMWYNLDLPEVMEVRRRFVRPTENIRQIEFSAPDRDWMDLIPRGLDSALVVIEGLSMHLTRRQVSDMLAAIRNRFSSATVMIEIMSPYAARHVSGGSFRKNLGRSAFGARSGSELAAMVPGYVHETDVDLSDGTEISKKSRGLLSRFSNDGDACDIMSVLSF